MAETCAPATLSNAALRTIALALAPLGDVDAIAGLRARYRDPRELPGTGGGQRDAEAALAEAAERGELAAARVAWSRYRCLNADVRRTAWWIAQRGRAVRDGAIVGVAEWALTYGTLAGALRGVAAPAGAAEAAGRVETQATPVARPHGAAAGDGGAMARGARR